MRTRLIALILAASAASFGADRDFDRLVKAVESRFGTAPTHIPLMGVANFVVKVARPEGASEFHLALFENLRLDPEDSGAKLDRIMAEISHGLTPLVRVRSNQDHRWTYVYATPDGNRTRMLVATFDRDEATVVEVKLSVDALMKRLRDPETAGMIGMGSRGRRSEKDDDRP